MSTFTAAQVREQAEYMRGHAEDDRDDYRLTNRDEMAHLHDTSAAMLDAFAERLEAEEHGERRVTITNSCPTANVIITGEDADKPLIVHVVPRELAINHSEHLREEGRREVLAEIAKIARPDWHDPDNEPGIWTQCVFCGASPLDALGDHKPDCLWLRAQQVTP